MHDAHPHTRAYIYITTPAGRSAWSCARSCWRRSGTSTGGSPPAGRSSCAKVRPCIRVGIVWGVGCGVSERLWVGLLTLFFVTHSNRPRQPPRPLPRRSGASSRSTPRSPSPWCAPYTCMPSTHTPDCLCDSHSTHPHHNIHTSPTGEPRGGRPRGAADPRRGALAAAAGERRQGTSLT